MRIAQVSPLYESVPPKCYGGTERVVSYLTEELVRLGHEVTLFASGDSVTEARLISPCSNSLRLNAECKDHLLYHMLLLEQVAKHQEEFDLIHFHIDYLHFPWSRRSAVPTLTTLHGRLDLPDLKPLYDEFDDLPLVSISNSQRLPLPSVNWKGTVYHGLPRDLYSFCDQPEDYLIFLGRISPEKGVEDAIQIARRAGLRLKIAAKVDSSDIAYFHERVQPLLSDSDTEFIGEVGDEQKNVLLGGARALLAPVNWPEPFGLVMIESLACGTPVIAYPRGSVPELIQDGASGFIVRNAAEATDAVKRLSSFDRRRCRQIFEERFTDHRMAQEYLAIYDELTKEALLRNPVSGERSEWTRSFASMNNSIS